MRALPGTDFFCEGEKQRWGNGQMCISEEGSERKKIGVSDVY